MKQTLSYPTSLPNHWKHPFQPSAAVVIGTGGWVIYLSTVKMGSCGQLDSECKMLQKIWSHQPIDDKWQDAVANSRIAAVNFSCIHPGLFILGRPQMTKRSMVANFFGPPSGDPQLWSRFKSESPIVCILGVGCQIFSSGGCWLLEHAETTRWSPLLMWIYRYLYTAFLYQHHLRKGYTTIVHRQKVTKKNWGIVS